MRIVLAYLSRVCPLGNLPIGLSDKVSQTRSLRCSVSVDLIQRVRSDNVPLPGISGKLRLQYLRDWLSSGLSW